MTISEYILKSDFRAPAVNLAPGASMSYKSYSKDSKVTGYVMQNEDPNIALTDVPIIITPENTAIPLSLITKLRDIEIDGKAVNIPAPLVNETAASPQGELNNTKLPSKYQDELNKIKQKYVISNVVKKSRNSVNGMLMGAVAGIIIAAIFKKPTFPCIIVGSIGGGLLGNQFTKDITAADIKTKTV